MTKRDQNDRLRDGDLPLDPEADAVLMTPNPEVRAAIARLVPKNAEPNDAQAEASLLGMLLWCGAHAPGTVTPTHVADLVPSAEAFYVAAHVQVYAAMVDVMTAQKPIDVVTVHSELVRLQRSRGVGGVDYLEKLVSLVETTSVVQARAYAQAIRDAWLRRKTADIVREVLADCAKGAEPAPSVVAMAMDKLKSIAEAGTSDAGTVSVKQSVLSIFEQLRNGVRPSFYPTGFRDLDKLMTGLFPRETTIVAARTSIGKTALTTQIAEAVAAHPATGVLYVTLEMPAESFTQRILSGRAQVDPEKLRLKSLAGHELARIAKVASELAQLPIYFAQSQSQTILSIHAMARARAAALAVEGVKLGLIVVDHVGIVKPTSYSAKREKREQVTEVSRGLRFLAEQHGCHVIGLAQINRGFEGRGQDAPPRMSDLKDSGSLEEDADNVLIIHREKDKRGMFVDKPAQVIAAKLRNRPELGVFELDFKGGRFISRDGQDPGRDAAVYS